MQITSIYMLPKDWKTFGRLAREQGATTSMLIRQFVHEYVKNAAKVAAREAREAIQ